MYDTSTGQETRITTSNTIDSNPVIYGNKIVWQDERNGNSDIYMYDISTGQETQITTDTSDQIAPDIYENKIVWSDGRSGGGYDIYMAIIC